MRLCVDFYYLLLWSFSRIRLLSLFNLECLEWRYLFWFSATFTKYPYSFGLYIRHSVGPSLRGYNGYIKLNPQDLCRVNLLQTDERILNREQTHVKQHNALTL